MAWGKFEESLPTHPKILAAGATAAWLWFCGICYCRLNLTDGFIPKAMVPSLSPGLPAPFKHAAKLVDVRLWEDAVGGFAVHDYLKWNPAKEEVEHYRRAERDRKKGPPSARNPTGIQPESERVTEAESERLPNAPAIRTGAGARTSTSPSSASSGASAEVRTEESARETAVILAEVSPPVSSVPPSWRPPGGHNGHCFCARVCVTWGLHADLEARLGGENAGARLHAWYPKVLANYEGREIGDDLFAFWRNEFAAWVGTVTTQPAVRVAGKGAQTAHAFDMAHEAIERAKANR